MSDLRGDPGRWITHGERTLYDSPWMRLTKVAVEEPGGRRFEHHVVRMNRVASAVVPNGVGQVLMLWRHRFICNSWGWELPMGIVDLGEESETAASREVEEETGWRPVGLRSLARFQPAIGIADSPHEIFLADSATYIGAPTDTSEGGEVNWVDVDALPALIAHSQIVDATTIIGVLLYLDDLKPGLSDK